MAKALPIMFQGTHSDAGKSVIVTAFCRIFAQDGYKTAPFKSQNMALNSYITIDGKEIGRAQGVQAEAAGILATTQMNPILIKPNRDNEAQIVIHGKPYKNMEAGVYRKEFFQTGLQLIEESLIALSDTYERIVIEGAGSPAEVNLNDRELVNMRVARMANAPVVLIGDIEKGGVFASLVGTLQLLEPEDRDRVIGVIINKFRGDVRLLEPGLTWFEEYTGKPVLGVIPYMPHLNIDAEDSVILNQFTAVRNTEKELDIAVIRYPKISNFTDVDPFFAEPDCHVRFITRADQLQEPDLVILPGSKNTIEDLLFLRESGIAKRLLELHYKKKSIIFGICGGYQMLGESIQDPFAMESPHQAVDGLCLLPICTTITKEKTTVLSEGLLTFHGTALSVTGYEIHMGESKLSQVCEALIEAADRTDGCKSEDEQVLGTYFHGIFHNDAFRETLLNHIRQTKGLAPICNRASFNQLREEAFDRLADHVRRHVNVAFIEQKMEEFQKKGAGLMKHLLAGIQSVDKEIGQRVRTYIDTLTKPPGSLGRLEEIAIELAEMTSEPFPVVAPPGVIVFAADHGIVNEGVSAFGQEVTAQMVMNFLHGGAAINVFSKQIGAAFEVVDVGIAADIAADGAVRRKVRYGTANFCEQDAMTRQEAQKAIAVGYERAENMIARGSKCLILGEMGIGNTTASSAILAVLSGQSLDRLVGRGTGIAPERIAHKQAVIARAIAARKPDRYDPVDILAKVGGLEIAAMAGAMLAGAAHRIPILVDGFICTVAALLAKELCSTASEYMIVGHRSVEAGHDIAIGLLGKKPLLDLGLRLGEGSGAAVAFPILRSATLMLKEMATFASAGISNEQM